MNEQRNFCISNNSNTVTKPFVTKFHLKQQNLLQSVSVSNCRPSNVLGGKTKQY